MLLTLLIVVLIVITVTYVVWIAFTAPPHWSLYVYAALWLIVPKALRLTYLTGGRYDLPHGMTVFNVLEAIAALGILATLLNRRRARAPTGDERSVQRLCILFALAAVFVALSSAGVFSPILPLSGKLANFMSQTTHPQDRILGALSVVYGSLFVVASMRFLRSMRQIETLLWFFALSGVELALERIVFVNLHLLSTFQRFAVNAGHFNSLVFTNYDFVAFFAILSIIASLYLALTGRRLAWITFGLAWLPLLSSYQRSPLLAAVAAIITVGAFSVTRETRIVVTVAGIIVVGLLLGTDLFSNVSSLLGHSLGGHVRTNYFNSDNFVERLGLWKRAIDTFGFFFPGGAGPGMAAYAMKYPIPHATVGIAAPLAAQMYNLVASGTRLDAPHDLLLEVLVDFGLFGVLLAGTTAVVTAKLFIHRLRPSLMVTDQQQRRARLLQVISFAMLVGIGVAFIFNNDQLPYFVYGMPLALIVASSRAARMSARAPRPPVSILTEEPAERSGVRA